MFSQTGYRPYIDGLRALAILSVILYHVAFRFTPGGFLGVDIFFVISGYLITSHIASELENGRFSLARFYERRVRRIAPALCFMLACASVGSYFLLYPVEMLEFEKALVAAVLSFSNIYFWRTTNYFSDQHNPLLHTWSLGVEEQFYLVIPLLLMMIFRYRRRWLAPSLIGLTLASLLLCVLTSRQHPEATFYLLPQRAFELLIGSLSGLGILRCPDGRIWRELACATGLAMMLVLIIRLPVSWQFPGPGVLVPCMGTALVLMAGSRGRTWTGALLSIKPLTGVGLISYSAYLWHVPLIAFSDHMTGIVYGNVLSRVLPFLSFAQAITAERILLLTAASLFCGFLSWKFVEQPIRFGQFKPPRRVLYSWVAAAVVVLLIASSAVIAARGLPGRYPAEVIAIASVGPPNAVFEDGICFPIQISEFEPGHCNLPDPGRPNWLLIGDSHAGHLDPGLHAVFPEVNIMQFVLLGCKPVPDRRFGESEGCGTTLQKFYSDYLPKHHFDLVILSAYWQPFDIPRIQNALDRLSKLHQPAMLVGPIMRYDAPLRLLLANQILNHDPTLADRHRVLAFDQLDTQMANLAGQEWHVPYFSFKVLCPGGPCMVWSSKDVPLQWDDTHLTGGGSVIAVQAMRNEGVLRPTSPYAVELAGPVNSAN
jgi:peptidoglycan/LPS O-acetylase OafA/YrhL